MFCPECGAEYRESFTECSDCQVALVAERPVSEQGDPDLEPVLVFETMELASLSMAEAALSDAGIEYAVGGQRLYAAGFPVNRPAWIKVAPDDLARSREALAYLDGTVGAGE